MRENGTLRYRFLSEAESEFDENGNPRESDVSWSAEIPCLVRTVNDKNNAKYVDGEYRAMSFEVLIESIYECCCCATSIMLSRKGECLGEFRIISKEALPTVGRIRIIV